jgi:hypothetical protein
MQRAERYRTELLKRGVLLIPVIFGASQKAQSKPRGFGSSRSAASAPSVGDDFEKRTESIAAKSRLKAEERFKADIVSPEQWESWIRDQQESEGVTPGEDVYIILRLDGRVRRSGRVILLWILVGHRKIYTTSVLKYEEFRQNPLYFETEIVLNDVISIV